MRTCTPLASIVVGVLIAGCANADFALGPEAIEDAGPDVASLESAVVEDTGAKCVVNACGGCGTLAIPPGMPCGICASSTYACTSETSTACTKPDDRVAGTEVVNSGNDRKVSAISATSGAAIVFTMPRTAVLAEISISLGGAGVPGSLRVRVIRGTPVLAPAVAGVLADVFIPGATVPTAATPVKIALPPGVSMLNKDEPLYVELTSPDNGFVLYGTSSGGEPQVLDRTATGYVRSTSVNAYLTLGVRACP